LTALRQEGDEDDQRRKEKEESKTAPLKPKSGTPVCLSGYGPAAANTPRRQIACVSDLEPSFSISVNIGVDFVGDPVICEDEGEEHA
jgi:hypothetical protein